MSADAHRIIDANLNRAREALRVMEEYARFVLNDTLLCGAIKEIRHELAAHVTTFERRDGTTTTSGEPAKLIRARDITGDVGRRAETPAEYQRADAVAVALAAGKRLSEALRVIEEYGKTLDPDLARNIERLRYHGYEIERRLAITLDARRRFENVHLYVILTASLCRTDWFATAEAALRGGTDAIQLREKDLPDHDLYARAERLVRLCAHHHAVSIINDRPDVAAAVAASGVHLGQDDIPVTAARRILPPGCLVGLSTHTIEQIRAGAADAPDYLAVGPMFPTPTKPHEPVAGPAILRDGLGLTGLPLVPIGGITDASAPPVLAAGARCLCVCRAVIDAEDPESAARRLRQLVERNRAQAGADDTVASPTPT